MDEPSCTMVGIGGARNGNRNQGTEARVEWSSYPGRFRTLCWTAVPARLALIVPTVQNAGKGNDVRHTQRNRGGAGAVHTRVPRQLAAGPEYFRDQPEA